MPLPPAPSKRADRLTAKAFDAPARGTRPQRKAEGVAPVRSVAVEIPLVKAPAPVLPQLAALEAPRAEKPASIKPRLRPVLPEPFPRASKYYGRCRWAARLWKSNASPAPRPP